MDRPPQLNILMPITLAKPIVVAQKSYDQLAITALTIIERQPSVPKMLIALVTPRISSTGELSSDLQKQVRILDIDDTAKAQSSLGDAMASLDKALGDYIVSNNLFPNP